MGTDVKDGRRTRWEDHRESRRVELVEAAVRAIDRHGADAGIAEIATEAGVSKPVLYRFFADKDDLHAAVGQWGADQLISRLAPIALRDAPLEDRCREGAAAFIDLIDAHPHVFRLVVRRPVDSPRDARALIAAQLSRWLGGALRSVGADAGGAEPWAHGLVGQGLATGEWWLERRTMSRKAVAGYLATFIWHAFEGIAREYGVDLAGSPAASVTPLRKEK
jgi:AcrR family transcriptional regulator